MTQEYFTVVERPHQETSEIIAEMKSRFDVYSFYNTEILDRDFPPPKEATVRYFKKNIEADEEYKDRSANDLEKEGVKGITLRERLILELDYFKETGEHLDQDNITLCAGSRNSGGGVPGMSWYRDSREVQVDWCSPDDRDPYLRTRAAVPNPSPSSLVSFSDSELGNTFPEGNGIERQLERIADALELLTKVKKKE